MHTYHAREARCLFARTPRQPLLFYFVAMIAPFTYLLKLWWEFAWFAAALAAEFGFTLAMKVLLSAVAAIVELAKMASD